MELPEEYKEYFKKSGEDVSRYWLIHWIQHAVNNWLPLGAYAKPASMLPLPDKARIVVVASGYSLESDIEKLRDEWQHDAYVICGPSNLPALIYNGIKPDLCLCVDAAEETAHYIRRLRADDVTGVKFLVHPAIHPYVVEQVIRANFDTYLFTMRIPEEHEEEGKDHWYNKFLQTLYPHTQASMAMAASTGNAQVLTTRLFSLIGKKTLNADVDLPVYLLGYDFMKQKGVPSHVSKYEFINGNYRRYRTIIEERNQLQIDAMVSFFYLVHQNRIRVYDLSSWQRPFPFPVPKVEDPKEDYGDEYRHDEYYEAFIESLKGDLSIQKVADRSE